MRFPYKTTWAYILLSFNSSPHSLIHVQWAAEMSGTTRRQRVAVIGAGPAGLCCLKVRRLIFVIFLIVEYGQIIWIGEGRGRWHFSWIANYGALSLGHICQGFYERWSYIFLYKIIELMGKKVLHLWNVCMWKIHVKLFILKSTALCDKYNICGCIHCCTIANVRI